MSALDQVKVFVRTESLFEAGQTIVAGVSGGADSLCLMHGLRSLGYEVVAAHFDHGIRPGGDAEADLVRRQAEAAGCVFVGGRGQVPDEAAAAHEPLEAAARRARYRFLFRVATERGLTHLATGHTRDDQVETVLMNLVRGTGLAGLGGMRPVGPVGIPESGGIPGASVFLARPLLCLSRDETVAYCRRHGLETMSDPSNQDRAFLRNRIRLDLLPELESYNPEVRAALWRLAEVARGLDDWVVHQAKATHSTVVREAGEEVVALQASPFLALHVALQREVLRQMLERYATPLREAGLESVERLRRAVVSGRPSRQTVAGGLVFERVADEWVLAPIGAQACFPSYPLLARQITQPLPATGMLELAAGWELHVERTAPGRGAVTSEEVPALGRLTAVFDGLAMERALALRPPQVGDRLSPTGMDGTVKLSDLFINRKIPRAIRHRWPVVEGGGEVLWVAGLRQSRAHPITASSRAILRLSLRKAVSE